MNALPILLAGGAALLLMGGKKKSNGRAPVGKIQIPPDAPPPLSKTVKKSGSGYPGISRGLMQEIQTMLMALGYDLGDYGSDGKYGSKTKAAVLAFQKDHMPESDGWDGKPGTKTQTALRKAEAARTMEQLVAAQDSPQQASQLVDECDPLDPGTWGSGNVCVFDGSRWVRKRAQVAAPKAAPKTQPSGTKQFEPFIDIEADQVVTYEGHKFNIAAWVPENMAFITWARANGQATIIGPYGIKSVIPYAKKHGYYSSFYALRDQALAKKWKRIVLVNEAVKWRNSAFYMIFLEGMRSAAIYNPDVLFVIVRTTNRPSLAGSAEIRVFDYPAWHESILPKSDKQWFYDVYYDRAKPLYERKLSLSGFDPTNTEHTYNNLIATMSAFDKAANA